jgi:hypothetical protein
MPAKRSITFKSTTSGPLNAEWKQPSVAAGF